MKRREFIAGIGAAAWPFATSAQQLSKIPRIGFLGAISASRYARQVDALLAGLRDLGYVDGKNTVIEFRWAEGNYDRLLELAAEFDRLKVDVLVTHGTPGTLAAKAAIKTIPIVAAVIGDPVATGVVTSLAKPGGNITGVAIFSTELAVKRMEILTQALPHVRRIAILVNPENTLITAILQTLEVAATSLALEIQQVAVRAPNEFESVFSSSVAGNTEGVVLVDDGMLIANAGVLGPIIAKLRLPSIGFTEFAQGGGLMAYGVNFLQMFRQAAGLVDKVLKGARPADLPIEQAIRFELLINLKTAKALGLTIPPTLLARADEVIE